MDRTQAPAVNLFYAITNRRSSRSSAVLLFLSLCVPQYPVTKTVKVNDTHRGKLKFTRVINKADNISNVILKLVHVTTISISYSECVSHPACKASVPYYVVVCGSSGSIIFFLHYLINA